MLLKMKASNTRLPFVELQAYLRAVEISSLGLVQVVTVTKTVFLLTHCPGLSCSFLSIYFYCDGRQMEGQPSSRET